MAVSARRATIRLPRTIHPGPTRQPHRRAADQDVALALVAVPTTAVVVVLVTVVVVGRLGQVSSRLAPRPRLRGRLPTDRATGRSACFADRRPPAGLPVRGRADRCAGRHPVGQATAIDDGIPAVFDGDPVLRVRDAATLPVGSVALVGGWSRRAPCPSGEGANPCLALLSDIPFVSPHVAALALGGQAPFDYRRDRASSAARCSPTRAARSPRSTSASRGSSSVDRCGRATSRPHRTTRRPGAAGRSCVALPDARLPAVRRGLVVPGGVAGAVVSRFAADVRAPNHPGLQVRLVLVFPVRRSRGTGAGLREAAARMTPFDASNRCVAIPGGVDDDGWMVRDNVMVLLGGDDDVRATVRRGPRSAAAGDDLDPGPASGCRIPPTRLADLARQRLAQSAGR